MRWERWERQQKWEYKHSVAELWLAWVTSVQLYDHHHQTASGASSFQCQAQNTLKMSTTPAPIPYEVNLSVWRCGNAATDASISVNLPHFPLPCKVITDITALPYSVLYMTSMDHVIFHSIFPVCLYISRHPGPSQGRTITWQRATVSIKREKAYMYIIIQYNYTYNNFCWRL